MRALIVDDSRFIRNHLRGLLTPLGMECQEAENGADGLDVLRASAPFDVTLLDWNMPVMDGLEMLCQMRAEGFTSVKVLMVTTESEHTNILRALEAGADEYLMKPFEAEALSGKLAMMGLVGA